MLRFTKGTRFGRALIVSGILLLVGVVFTTINPLSTFFGFLGGQSTSAEGTVMFSQVSAGPGIAANAIFAPVPVCKGPDGPCVTVEKGKMPDGGPGENGIYIRKVPPGPFSGSPWAPLVSAFFAIWTICAIIACYILIQETLNVVTNHFQPRD